MKTTVEYKKVAYETNDRTITCHLVFSLNYWKIKNINAFLHCYDVERFVSNYIDKSGNITFHVIGSATCSQNDSYDFETGRRLAFTRAQENAFNKAYDFLAEIERRAVIDLENTMDNCIMSADKCATHYKELVDRL